MSKTRVQVPDPMSVGAHSRTPSAGPMISNVPRSRSAKSRRAFWLKQVYRWHWISSAICLAAMLLFAVTGITLNHAGQIGAEPTVTEVETNVPPDLLRRLRSVRTKEDTPLPAEVESWLRRETGVSSAGRSAEWSESEVYVALPRPGGDAWLSIDLGTGHLLYEHTDRGWISYLNDLHKGRNTGTAWGWFIDVFAGACIVFSLTGLVLLHTHSARRPLTWPVVAIGLGLPALIAAFFIH